MRGNGGEHCCPRTLTSIRPIFPTLGCSPPPHWCIKHAYFRGYQTITLEQHTSSAPLPKLATLENTSDERLNTGFCDQNYH